MSVVPARKAKANPMFAPVDQQPIHASVLILAEDIAAAKNFTELERLRRKYQTATGLRPNERLVLENALARCENALVEFYQIRL
jgi:hypothetical protein